MLIIYKGDILVPEQNKDSVVVQLGNLNCYLKPQLALTNNSRKIFLCGDIDYFDYNEKKYFPDEINDKIKKTILNADIKNIENYIEGNYYLLILENNKLYILLDKFAKQDIYFYDLNGKLLISDSLEIFYRNDLCKEFDQEALACFFTVYGNYAPKKHTLFKNIKRIGHREYLEISNRKIKIKDLPLEIYNIEDYSDDKLDEYHKLLYDAIYYRSSRNGTNWIYLSSGWDSTAILGYLREMYEADRIRGVIGKIKYSNRSGIINKYEIDRAKQFVKYYGIKSYELYDNQTTLGIDKYLSSLLSMLKNNGIFSLNSIGFSLLSDYVKNNSDAKDSVFCGEISDGAHNLGFAQYTTILEHPDLNFREYSDKMASYLFSPSFLNHIINKNFKKDFVYNTLINRFQKECDWKLENYDEEILKQIYLTSFYLSSVRIPFYNNQSKLFSRSYTTIIHNFMNEYFYDYAKILSTKNFYSVMLNLYNSFHWQGSTIRIINKSHNRYLKYIKLPFWDKYILHYLSKMPENWGRGLDFNNTKYPLKWTLNNKIKYPIHLQRGPHSYIYDDDASFNITSEIIYGSQLCNFFKESINKPDLMRIFDEKIINVTYLKSLKRDYLNNKIVDGEKLQHLLSLILLSVNL